MAGRHEPSPTVPSGACQHHHSLSTRVTTEKPPGKDCEIATRVLRHPLQGDPEILDHGAVDLAHLIDSDPRDASGRNGRKLARSVSRQVVSVGAHRIRPSRLQIHTESVGDAIHVVEVGYDLVAIDDGSIVKPDRVEGIHIGASHVRWGRRKPKSVPAKGRQAWTEALESTGDDRLRERSIPRFPENRLAVMDHSVVAVVGGRDAYRHRLTFEARKGGLPEHDGPIQGYVGSLHSGIQAMTRENVVEPLAALTGRHP